MIYITITDKLISFHEDWRISTSHELEKPTNVANMLRFIKTRRLSWLRHIVRMD